MKSSFGSVASIATSCLPGEGRELGLPVAIRRIDPEVSLAIDGDAWRGDVVLRERALEREVFARPRDIRELDRSRVDEDADHALLRRRARPSRVRVVLLVVKQSIELGFGRCDRDVLHRIDDAMDAQQLLCDAIVDLAVRIRVAREVACGLGEARIVFDEAAIRVLRNHLELDARGDGRRDLRGSGDERRRWRRITEVAARREHDQQMRSSHDQHENTVAVLQVSKHEEAVNASFARCGFCSTLWRGGHRFRA